MSPFVCGAQIGAEVVQRGAIYTLCQYYKDEQFYGQIQQLYMQQNTGAFFAIEQLTLLDLNSLLTYQALVRTVADAVVWLLAVRGFLDNARNVRALMCESFQAGLFALVDRFARMAGVQRAYALVVRRLLELDFCKIIQHHQDMIGRVKRAISSCGDVAELRDVTELIAQRGREIVSAADSPTCEYRPRHD